ncbi:MCE family protein, partial [Mycobacterium tuberculosis]|nr:MCE family protein [Mycobacterium tuberculosis]
MIGLATVLTIAAAIALPIGLFRGSFTRTVPVTVLSQRAGLVMYPDAKVKIRGVQVGKVGDIETKPDGTAVLHLQMEPGQLSAIPANVSARIASSTVFGAKF